MRVVKTVVNGLRVGCPYLPLGQNIRYGLVM